MAVDVGDRPAGRGPEARIQRGLSMVPGTAERAVPGAEAEMEDAGHALAAAGGRAGATRRPDPMRKPRDIDAELKMLQDRQKRLRARRTVQLGEIVSATGAADQLDPETLAGALIDAVERAQADADAKEAWRRKGEGFFRRERRSRGPGADGAGDAAAAAAPGGGSPAAGDGGPAAG